MTENEALRNILHSTAQRMLADFEATREALHRASKGSLREETVRKFLKSYLSRNVDVVGSGEIVSIDGQRSTQCDVMITDPTAPFLYGDAEPYRIAMAEAVFGVIEVKSFLSAEELRQSVRKIADLKAMPRTAYYPPLGPVRYRKAHGQRWENLPLSGMIFAYDGAELDTLGEALAEVSMEIGDHPELKVDSIWILKKGTLVWVDSTSERIQPGPEPGDFIGSLRAEPGEVLVHMVFNLHEHFATAWTTGVRLTDYLGKASFGHRDKLWTPEDRSSPDGADRDSETG